MRVVYWPEVDQVHGRIRPFYRRLPHQSHTHCQQDRRDRLGECEAEEGDGLFGDEDELESPDDDEEF